MKPPFMLNMIVRNESARIERCLKSVLPYVKAAAILDTGSTDGTQEIIRRLCGEAAVPVLIRQGEFKNFSQARNEAFRLARAYNNNEKSDLIEISPHCQFALLVDADMQLVVADDNAFDDLDARAPSYDMMQKGGTVSYGNRRLVNLAVDKDIYVGVTHEYIDVNAAGMITGAAFVDHADGSNRKDKYVRDIALLTADLERDPNNGRSLYYLGNSYRDGNNPLLAVDAYERRIALGGWDEETHSAMMNLAHAHKDAGNEAAFVKGLLDAYNFRPSRAEPIYDLAKHYREKGFNSIATMFAKTGMKIERPNDLLFVNDFVYDHGLRYEYSVAGYYDPRERDSAFEAADDLALDRACPTDIRISARNNLFWYTKPLKDYCPSFVGKKIEFTPPDGYTAMNPSVTTHEGLLICNIRCVNYKINEYGQYMIGPKQCGDAPIDTRNFIVYLDQKTLAAHYPAEIIWHRPQAKWDMVTGIEDIRLHSAHGALQFTGNAREQNAGGMPQMITGYIVDDLNPAYRATTNWNPISDERCCEKNWMPVVGAGGWLYNCETYIDEEEKQLVNQTKLHVEDLRGSSQAIPFKNGYLAIVHEASGDPTNGKRTYWHRFVWFDQGMALHRISKPFVFYDRQIEFCAGMTAVGHSLVISFGVRDAEAHLAVVDQLEVSRMLSLYKA